MKFVCSQGRCSRSFETPYDRNVLKDSVPRERRKVKGWRRMRLRGELGDEVLTPVRLADVVRARLSLA